MDWNNSGLREMVHIDVKDNALPAGPLPQKPDIRDNRDGTYDVTYIAPPVEGATVHGKVTWGGEDVKNRLLI